MTDKSDFILSYPILETTTTAKVKAKALSHVTYTSHQCHLHYRKVEDQATVAVHYFCTMVMRSLFVLMVLYLNAF